MRGVRAADVVHEARIIFVEEARRGAPPEAGLVPHAQIQVLLVNRPIRPQEVLARGRKAQHLRVEFAHDGWDVLLDHEARLSDGFGVLGLEPDEVGHELEVTARIRRAALEALLG